MGYGFVHPLRTPAGTNTGIGSAEVTSPLTVHDSLHTTQQFNALELRDATRRRELRLDSFNNSALKGLRETRLILALLRENGLDEEAVPEAYQAAYQVRKLELTYGAGSLSAVQRTSEWKEHLAVEYGLTNEHALTRLFEVGPTLPWGAHTPSE